MRVRRLVKSYRETHGHASFKPQFIQLGSSEIFTIPGQDTWVTRHSKVRINHSLLQKRRRTNVIQYNASHPRAIAEDELISLGGCVLNLSGLWGGQRQPIHWIDRVADTKEKLASKTSLHMVHGFDVAKSVIAVHQGFAKAAGQTMGKL